MVWLGVWIPEGCEPINNLCRIAREKHEAGETDFIYYSGDPVRDGAVYSSQLSVFNALFPGASWGQFAADFVSKKDIPRELRQWVNEDKGETWELVPSRQTWEELGTKLIDNSVDHLVVPFGFDTVTVGIDKQKDHYAYTVKAWSDSHRSHTLDYGTVKDDDGLIELLLREYRVQHDPAIADEAEENTPVPEPVRLRCKGCLLYTSPSPRD